ncbi:MAG: hypothetical protein PHV59_04285 [Victivallales bacterium]|nr:hypothetical protein [Victivallales bacterium]
MKIKLNLYPAAAVLLLLLGCSSFQHEKLPAGDVDIYTIYASEIDILHNSKLRPDSQLKYEAAMTLYRNVDFSFIREVGTLEKIFGAGDAHMGKANFEKQDIIFLYRYKGQRVRFVFTRYNNTVIHSECTDKL